MPPLVLGGRWGVGLGGRWGVGLMSLCCGYFAVFLVVSCHAVQARLRPLTLSHSSSKVRVSVPDPVRSISVPLRRPITTGSASPSAWHVICAASMCIRANGRVRGWQGECIPSVAKRPTLHLHIYPSRGACVGDEIAVLAKKGIRRGTGRGRGRGTTGGKKGGKTTTTGQGRGSSLTLPRILNRWGLSLASLMLSMPMIPLPLFSGAQVSNV